MRLLPVSLALLFGAVLPASGQVLIRVLQDNTITQIANGGIVAVSSPAPNQPRDLTITITYVGSGSMQLLTPQLSGSGDFTIISAPATGRELGPSQNTSVQVRYQPSSTRPVAAELTYDFLEVLGPQVTRRGVVAVGFNGSVPEYALNYSLPIDGNVVNLAPNGTLPFTETPLNNNTIATLVVVNRGFATGQLLSVTTTGDAFSLISLPLVPRFIPSGGTFQFQLRYRPRQAGTDTGSLTLTFEGGITYSAGLTGRGIASYLTYELLRPEGAPETIQPNQAVPVVLPTTPVGQRATVFIRFRNASDLDISVPGIAITGAAFVLSDVPFLPLVLAPRDSQLFSLTFAPTQPGRQTGRLRVGNDTFELAGDASGPVLTYSYRTAGGITSVLPLGGVVFPGVPVGQPSLIDFTIRNTGTAPAPVVNIGIVSEGRPVFTLQGLPPLPSAIEPNSSMTFRIQYLPLASGPAAASLRINTDAFTLSGIARTPEPLPDYIIQGPSSAQALEQPAVSLTLTAPYPVGITGTLTLSVESDTFAADPSVLFATGSKTTPFTIAAGTTRAVFPNGANEIKFQTGSAAGIIVVTPAFSAGGFDITPEGLRRLRVTLPSSVPRLFSLSVDGRTANVLTLQVAGVTTTRSLTKLTVSFKGKPGFNFPQTGFEYDLTANSLLWFTSQTSIPFGGQFVAQIPFGLNITGGAVPPIQAIESVTVSMTNERGASNSLTTLIQ